ncbi:hypothetical protein TNCV_3762791 [Trichonephila clavipes]|nr:hypothetical protein TNCV_3762791 [Trichonephila clavipes]
MVRYDHLMIANVQDAFFQPWTTYNVSSTSIISGEVMHGSANGNCRYHLHVRTSYACLHFWHTQSSMVDCNTIQNDAFPY